MIHTLESPGTQWFKVSITNDIFGYTNKSTQHIGCIVSESNVMEYFFTFPCIHLRTFLSKLSYEKAILSDVNYMMTSF